jgi:mono/diheme cytochrome c family protein
MADETGDRPGGSERSLPARRTVPDAVPARPTERFTAPRQTRAIGGLTSERAARIVRQTGDARWVAFLGLVVVALFVIVYYFYELGVPIINTTPRLDAEANLQQVTSVERGYNLYMANCARCHGDNGEGKIGPVLNDQSKLFSHFTERYLRNVLEVGGRYVCGDPKSQMPVWADTNGGPLNYVQIDDLIAFIRADSTKEYVKRSHELNEPIIGADGKVETFKGWRDVTFKPAPSSTPVPDCYKGNVGGGTPAPQASLGPDAQILDVTTSGEVEFGVKALEAPASTLFGIKFANTTGLDHDVDIRAQDGTVLQDNPIVKPGETTTYTINALPAGTYTFICSIHPIASMTGTLTVN